MPNYNNFPGPLDEDTIRCLEVPKTVKSGKLNYQAPDPGQKLDILLVSQEVGHPKYVFSVYEGKRRSAIALITYADRKTTLQTRKDRVLARLDLDVTAKHTNPDGKLIVGPHLHIACEGYDDKWAVPLSEQNVVEGIKGYDMPSEVFEPFKRLCAIDDKLSIAWNMGV